jgi:hypothetical protein
MRIFECDVCRQLLYFENTSCVNCGHRLGFLPEALTLSALEPAGGPWKALEGGGLYKFCANEAQNACNWMLPADSPAQFCEACKFNQTIPDLSDPENLIRWQKIEIAKHRVVYTLIRLGLPLVSKLEDPQKGLAFDFLKDPAEFTDAPPQIMTGHDNGLITINLSEADDSAREKTRGHMGEAYRTLLGHLRHEIGHYYWDILVRDGAHLAEFRKLFGDETADYSTSLSSYYANGPAVNWQNNYVSAYASAHPWEDFAETWAHYLHILDTLETASGFRIRVDPEAGAGPDLKAAINFDPFEARSIDRLLQAWLPLTYAVNSLNRSMGQPDLYPFIITPAVITKLDYVHKLVGGDQRKSTLQSVLSMVGL